MADFVPPSGPPPPRVPEGWVARWNDQYHEWFYVNTFTKKSQWDKPTEPAVDPNAFNDGAPAGPPPGYSPGSGPAPSDSKNPFVNESTKPGSRANDEDADARLARQLQEEENARARTPGGGAAASYGSTPQPPQGYSPYPDQGQRASGSGTPADKAKGLLGKFFGSKNKHSGGGYPGQQYGGQQYGGYGSQGPPQQGYYSSPPPQQYGGYGPPPGQYGGGGYGGGYQQGGYGGGYQQQQGRKTGGGGMGMAGGAALGLGAGLIGGAVIADAIDDNDHEAYQDGYEDGGGGDDFGGGDF